MPWWAWLLGGILLAGVELAAVDAAFYLVFVGVAAIVVGLLELAGAQLDPIGQWLLFGALAFVSMVLFRQKVYNKLRGGLPGYESTATGVVVAVPEDVPVGGRSRVNWRGSQWDAANIGDRPIVAGTQARVVKTQGALLEIEALSEEAQLPEDGESQVAEQVAEQEHAAPQQEGN